MQFRQNRNRYMRVLVFFFVYSYNWNRQLEKLTFKHVDAGLSTVSHGVHEDKRKELGEHNSHFRSNQFVSDHLCKQCSRLLPDRRILRVAEQVEQVDQCTCESNSTSSSVFELSAYRIASRFLFQILSHSSCENGKEAWKTFACDLMLYALQDAKLCLGLAFFWFINSHADNTLVVVCVVSQFCCGNES